MAETGKQRGLARPALEIGGSRMIGALVALVLGMTIAVAPHPVRAEGGGLILMSPEQEKKIGAEQHPKILEEFGGAYDVPEIGGYVAELGGRLVAKSEMAGQAFTFTVLNSPVVNAFALPGGYVYISRGLMALANSEAELAGVLGHEVGHVTRRHSARRYTRAVGAGILSEVARIGGAILWGDAAGQILGQVAGMGSQLYVLKYSRDQEYEADEVGILYIDRVGYDPFAMADFLDSMQDQSVLAAQLQGFAVDPNQVDYFSTHPNTGERVRRATQNALGTGAIAGDLPARRDAYLDLIDGLLYGDDPKEGLVVDGQFVHPDLRFRFDVPDGFSVQNSPSAVRGRHESGGQFVFAGVRSNKGSSLAVINDTFRDREGGRLQQIRATEINGIDAATGVRTIRAQRGTFDEKLVVLNFGEGQYFYFMMLAPSQGNSAVKASLDGMAGSFERLSARDARAIKPRRVDVVTVRSGDTVTSLSERMAFDDFRKDRFLVLNALDEGAVLRPGERVKLVTF